MNPTVSVTNTFTLRASCHGLVLGSSVANNWSDTFTPALVMRLSRVDLPAFV